MVVAAAAATEVVLTVVVNQVHFVHFLNYFGNSDLQLVHRSVPIPCVEELYC